MRPAASNYKFVAVLVILLCSCSAPTEQRAEFFVFGTLVDVVVRGVDQQTAALAFTDLQQRFQAMHRDWHAWEPGALTRINQAFASGRKVKVPPDIRKLIRHSQELEVLSAGRFNAALGALIGLWGFHTSEYPVAGPVPGTEAIQILLDAAPSATNIILDGDIAYSNNPFVQLDFGAIAKGHAVDLAMDILAKHGIDNALVNAGGDLRAAGGTKDQPWKVGIRQPGGGVIGGIEITGSEAVFTSGVDQRYMLKPERRYPHILDPFTGMPVQGIASVTVIAKQGLFADVACTALIVAGLDSWLDVVQAFELESVMLIDDRGAIFMTPKMKARLKLAPGTKLQTTIVEPLPTN